MGVVYQSSFHGVGLQSQVSAARLEKMAASTVVSKSKIMRDITAYSSGQTALKQTQEGSSKREPAGLFDKDEKVLWSAPSSFRLGPSRSLAYLRPLRPNHEVRSFQFVPPVSDGEETVTTRAASWLRSPDAGLFDLDCLDEESATCSAC